MSDGIDLQQCETCPAEHPIEDMLLMDDGWMCQQCYGAFKEAFDACEHDWEPHVDQMGDTGRYCRKCSGFVADDVEALTDE